MANSIVKLTVEDSSFNAKIKEAAKTFATFGKNVASAGADAFGQFVKGAKSAKVAFEGFNTALKANALVLVASLAAEAGQALGNFISNWITGAEDAARVQDILNQKLEETKRLLDEMKYFDNFQMQLDKASGMETTKVLQRQFERTQERFERAKRLYALNANSDTEKEMEDANRDMVNAQRALQLDAVSKANGTGEYAPKSSGSRRTVKKEKTVIYDPVTMTAADVSGLGIGTSLNTPNFFSVNTSGMNQLQVLEAQLQNIKTQQSIFGGSSSELWRMFQGDIDRQQKRIDAFKNGEQQPAAERSIVKMTDIMGGVESGVSNVVSGIENLGITIPEGINSVLSGVQSMITILSGISSIVMAIEAISAADTIIPFARGGVARAAFGYSVPGNHFSGDQVHAMLNSGETVLTRAMTNNLASQLQGGGLQNLHLSATISGENIRLALNSNGRRTGRGEYVTTNIR